MEFIRRWWKDCIPLPKRKIIGVSGGIDSMLLMWRYRDAPGVVVAHFNHGTRPSADDDEAFVRKMAKRYGLKCVVGRAKLGEEVSEARARRARYDFLKEVAQKYDGEIVVAHHLDDLVESVAINLLRGTGWRGLAVMGNSQVSRPLIGLSKHEIYREASRAGIEYRQDPTNMEDNYLRNRVRERTEFLAEEKKVELGRLRERQIELRDEVDEIVSGWLPKDGRYQRGWFLQMEDEVALELLRAGLLRAGISATRPQIRSFLEAIREYQPEKIFNLPGGRLVKLHRTYFCLGDGD